MRCTNTPNSVKVDFYTSKCKKKVKFNRKIVSLVGESFYTKGCKSVKVNFYTLWCNGQHSKEWNKEMKFTKSHIQSLKEMKFKNLMFSFLKR